MYKERAKYKKINEFLESLNDTDKEFLYKKIKDWKDKKENDKLPKSWEQVGNSNIWKAIY